MEKELEQKRKREEEEEEQRRKSASSRGQSVVKPGADRARNKRFMPKKRGRVGL